MPRLIWVFAGCISHFVDFIIHRLISYCTLWMSQFRLNPTKVTGVLGKQKKQLGQQKKWVVLNRTCSLLKEHIVYVYCRNFIFSLHIQQDLFLMLWRKNDFIFHHRFSRQHRRYEPNRPLLDQNCRYFSVKLIQYHIQKLKWNHHRNSTLEKVSVMIENSATQDSYSCGRIFNSHQTTLKDSYIVSLLVIRGGHPKLETKFPDFSLTKVCFSLTQITYVYGLFLFLQPINMLKPVY